MGYQIPSIAAADEEMDTLSWSYQQIPGQREGLCVLRVGRKQKELTRQEKDVGIILVWSWELRDSFRVQICQLPAKQTIFCAISMYFIIKKF